jgi:hypothetical protein
LAPRPAANGTGLEQAWDNLLTCLAPEKLGPEHLVKIVYFTTVNAPEALKLRARSARANSATSRHPRPSW